jgi:hypothetical protein
MKDVVIGCITNYTFEQIKLFVNSEERLSSLITPSSNSDILIFLCFCVRDVFNLDVYDEDRN